MVDSQTIALCEEQTESEITAENLNMYLLVMFKL